MPRVKKISSSSLFFIFFSKTWKKVCKSSFYSFCQGITFKITILIAISLAITTLGGAYYAGNFTGQTPEEAKEMYLIAIIVTASGIIAGFYGVRMILQPIYFLDMKVKKFSRASKNFDTSTNKAFPYTKYLIEMPIRTKDETTQLIDSFNGMIRSLDEKQEKFLKSKEQYDMVLKKFNTKLKKEVDVKTKKLRDSYEKLKKLDDAKNEFISIASHELRTPMTIINGYSSMLLEDSSEELTEKQQKFLGKIRKNIAHLIVLINEMLDINRLESGMMEEKILPLNITVFLEEILKEFEFSFEKKNISLTIDIQEKKEIHVLANKKYLRSIATNLLSNAFKFTPEHGKVSLNIKRYAKKKDSIQIDIQDTGIGIKKEKLPVIFEKFQQVDNHLQRHQEGTGLGLAIVKKMIKKMNGKIWVKSTPKKGSTFSFVLPEVTKTT